MIKELLPLTQIRVDILSELYLQPLLGKEIADKIGRKPQVTYNTLTAMKKLLDKDRNLYSIKSEVRILLKKLLIKTLLERRLSKHILLLSYIKKYAKPKEMIFFGSFFRGDYDENSDIDIYILTELNPEIIAQIEEKLTRVSKRKIQIVGVHPDIHLTKKDKFSDLYKSISNDLTKGIKVPLDILE